MLGITTGLLRSETGEERFMPLDHAVNGLTNFVEFELYAVLGALAALIAYRLVTGQINTNGLLNDKATGKIDPGRIQLLVATVVAATAYLGDWNAFADQSVQTVAGGLLGASNIYYLVQKYRSMSGQ
jgi:hypothetical protein